MTLFVFCLVIFCVDALFILANFQIVNGYCKVGSIYVEFSPQTIVWNLTFFIFKIDSLCSLSEAILYLANYTD